MAYCNLGHALQCRGRSEKAEAACREAIRRNPNFPMAHVILGSALREQSRNKEAEVAFRDAIRLQPNYAEAHCGLGRALYEQGRFDDALEAMRRCHELGSETPGWRYPSADWVREYERRVELDRKLPAVLRGEGGPQ